MKQKRKDELDDNTEEMKGEERCRGNAVREKRLSDDVRPSVTRRQTPLWDDVSPSLALLFSAFFLLTVAKAFAYPHPRSFVYNLFVFTDVPVRKRVVMFSSF